MKKIPKPLETEYALYFQQYIDRVDATIPLLTQLKKNAAQHRQFFEQLPEQKLTYAYAEGKWTPKDILMHLIDTERVFQYRAMRFARQDKTPLPFFDENEFARQAQANKLSLSKLLHEYKATRNATLSMFNHFTAKQLKHTGVASNFPMSVRATAWVICGHELHHIAQIKNRYL